VFAAEARDKRIDQYPDLSQNMGAGRSQNVETMFWHVVIEKERFEPSARDEL